ncbi:MAG: AAA family ATPase [Lentisphaerae bacterium]|nr:AAA family ATPase [Lentisphaerota bacterium]
MKDITSSVYNFEDLIQGNFLYVDKTEYIWQLIRPAKESYFLSRPRRFGKSLTVSTLKAVFEGKKELFRGLAIYDKPYDWKPYPVIHLSLGDYNSINNTVELLNAYLLDKIKSVAADLSVELPAVQDASSAFGKLIDACAVKDDAVILVDEYDKPILDNISNPNIADIQKYLKGFYSVLKDRNAKERFLFVTGVSKFSHVSLFSDLNNLTDITMDGRYATMFGYTQDELEANFGDRIAAFAGDRNIEAYKAEIKNWYNGYRFEENAKTVYNPVSLAKFFETGGKFSNYWFSTGTPSFLLELIRKNRFSFEDVLSNPVSGFAFDAYEIDKLDPLTLLLQAGYLTIDKAFVRYGDTAYMLRFPNLEVKGSFEAYLTGDCSGLHVNQVKDSVYRLADKVTAGDVDGFMETMKVFFAKVPYDVHLKNENNFQLLFYSIFMLLGISITAESRTGNGHIDAVATNEDFVFVFEFKLNKDEEIALAQIKEKDYFRRYMNSGKNIMLVGVNFDREAGQITGWTYEKV